MTPKEYLSQAYKIERRINIINAKVSKLWSQLEYKGISYESCGSSCSASNDKMPDMIVKISEYEQKQNELAEKLLAKRFEIENVIDSVQDAAQREVLERRYLLYQRWEGHFDERTGEYVNGIAEDMNFSRRRIFQIHGEALKSIAPNCIELH